MNDPLAQFAVYSGAYVAVLMAIGFYAQHQSHKYRALAEAEREAEREAKRRDS
jgi:hypothetical protein